MQFGFLGIDYKNADLTIRDEISFTDQKKLEFFHKAEEIGVEQVMILSTCNRSEIYYFFDDEQQIKKIQNIYCDMFDKAEIEQYIRHCEEDKAVSYLFRVTAGLESMVLGEDQILGQVKDALDFSRTMGFSKKELNKVVRDAITCAKKVKTTFRISEKPVSVGYIGIRELQKICDIKDKMVLVIGSGDTAVLALRYLQEYEAKREKVSYSYKTMEHFRKMYPDDEFYFIIGADSLFSIETWKHPERLFKACIILAACRDEAATKESLNGQIQMLKGKYGAHIKFLAMPLEHVSSHEIRKLIESGEPVSEYIPAEVEAYIRKEGLYGSGNRKNQ